MALPPRAGLVPMMVDAVLYVCGESRERGDEHGLDGVQAVLGLVEDGRTSSVTSRPVVMPVMATFALTVALAPHVERAVSRASR
jgi:hypothetical protein